MSQPALTAAQIAEAIDGALTGPADLEVTGVASLLEAGPEHVSFLGNSKYEPQVKSSKAGVILVPADYEPSPAAGQAFIKCENPSRAFSDYVLHFAPPEIVPSPGIHPTAVMGSGVVIPASSHIGALVVIETGAKVGENVIIEAGCYIGPQVEIGDGTRLHPNVTIRERCILGQRVLIQSGSVVGSDGFGFELAQDGNKKIPQIGIVQIDDDVDVGACVTIDRARFGRTWIKTGVKIDNLCQIAHNVVVGENCVIVAQVGFAGSTVMGKHVIMAGQSGLPGHVTVGDGAVIMGKSGPIGDVGAGEMVMGFPAQPRRDFMRQIAYMHRLPDMAKELKALTKQVADLQAKLAKSDSE